MQTKFITIPDTMIKKEWWVLMSEETRFTGHMHYNSPYETCDSCGNCDGARCDYCREIKIPERYEVAIPVDELEKILKEITDLPDDLIRSLVYDDFGSPYVVHEDVKYYLEWPESKPVDCDDDNTEMNKN